MTAGPCPKCGKEKKNIEVHSRYCKGKSLLEKIEANNPDIKEAMKSDAQTTKEEPLTEPKLTQNEIEMKVAEAIRPTPWYKRLFSKQPKEKKKVNISELFDSLPKWSIKQRKPWGKPKNKNASWIQIVAFSRTRPPKAIWAEYDGVSVSVDDMFFPAPHDIRGDIFPYDMDKGIPLLENSDQYSDMSYWNKLVERVKNMYFTLGLISGAGDFTKNIGLILLLVCVAILAGIINMVLIYGLTKDFSVAAANIGNTTHLVQNYVATHP
jgi:hypothetical protein